MTEWDWRLDCGELDRHPGELDRPPGELDRHPGGCRGPGVNPLDSGLRRNDGVGLVTGLR